MEKRRYKEITILYEKRRMKSDQLLIEIKPRKLIFISFVNCETEKGNTYEDVATFDEVEIPLGDWLTVEDIVR